MHQWFIAVYTKIFGNVGLIHIKISLYDKGTKRLYENTGS